MKAKGGAGNKCVKRGLRKGSRSSVSQVGILGQFGNKNYLVKKKNKKTVELAQRSICENNFKTYLVKADLLNDQCAE